MYNVKNSNAESQSLSTTATAIRNYSKQRKSPTQEGLNDLPSPINALNRLKMIIRGKSPGIVQDEFNTQDGAAGSEGFIVNSVLKNTGIVAAAKGSMRKAANAEDP
ncbi:hypothetical protein PR048_005383, partial [Dryococelus australis]